MKSFFFFLQKLGEFQQRCHLPHWLHGRNASAAADRWELTCCAERSRRADGLRRLRCCRGDGESNRAGAWPCKAARWTHRTPGKLGKLFELWRTLSWMSKNNAWQPTERRVNWVICRPNLKRRQYCPNVKEKACHLFYYKWVYNVWKIYRHGRRNS